MWFKNNRIFSKFAIKFLRRKKPVVEKLTFTIEVQMNEKFGNPLHNPFCSFESVTTASTIPELVELAYVDAFLLRNQVLTYVNEFGDEMVDIVSDDAYLNKKYDWYVTVTYPETPRGELMSSGGRIYSVQDIFTRTHHVTSHMFRFREVAIKRYQMIHELKVGCEQSRFGNVNDKKFYNYRTSFQEFLEKCVRGTDFVQLESEKDALGTGNKIW